MNIRRQILILLLLMVALGSCADPTKGIVSGTVTVDGQPAKTGAISFIPVDGRSSTAGAVIENGHYQAAVPVAKVRVEIRVPQVYGEKKLYDTPDSPVQPLMKESLPPKFNDESELTYEVTSGHSTKDYSLTSE